MNDNIWEFAKGLIGKPYRYDGGDLGVQSDYALAGDKDAPEGEAYPVAPSVMK